MGAVSAHALLALAATLLASAQPAPSPFDHLALRSAAALPPLDLVALQGGVWRTSPADVFPADGGGSEVHLHARDLGASAPAPPPGARWLVRAVARGGPDVGATRVGYLVPRAADAPPPAPVGKLDAASFVGSRFRLSFPDGSGFYRDLRVAGASAPLVHAIRLRLDVRLPGGFTVTRTEQDFRWTVDRLDAGARFARRASSASARALFGHTDPRPQTALLADDLIEQRVAIELPPALLALASEVTLENGFAVAPRTMVLLPGADAWQAVSALPAGAAYTWLVLASDTGALLHRLAPEGAAVALAPALYAAARDDGTTWEVGYRLEHVEDASSAAAQNGGFVLGQHVAILGDGAWARALLDDAAATRDLARTLASAIAEPPPAYRATLEEIAP